MKMHHRSAPVISTRHYNNPPGTQTTINHHYDGGEEQDDRIIRWAIVVENARKRNGTHYVHVYITSLDSLYTSNVAKSISDRPTNRSPTLQKSKINKSGFRTFSSIFWSHYQGHSSTEKGKFLL